MLIMEKETVPVRTLKQYLSQNRTLSVPLWQREYVWEANDSGQVGVLLEDLRDFVEKGQENYLIGSVILCRTAKKPGEDLIIDGQQRTLTFLLFLMCARKYIRTHNLLSKNNDKHNQLMVDIRNCLTSSQDEYKARVRMNQSKANEILEEIWLWSNASAGVGEDFFSKTDRHTQTQQNLASVVRYIYENQFEKQGWINQEKFVDAIEKVMNTVRFVELTLDDQTEAISVFDHINDRGVGLSGADLIKNRIFQDVEDEGDFGLISDSWSEMSSTLNKISGITRLHDPKYLLRALAWTQSDGKKITYENLADFWKKSIDNKAIRATEFAQNLAQDALYLSGYGSLKHDLHGSFEQLFLAKHLKSVQHYPVLLAIRNYADSKVFRRVVKQVHNRTCFYVLAQERTQEFEKIIPKWASELQKLGGNATIDKVDAIYLKEAPLKDSDFEKLHNEMLSWNYEIATDRAKIRAVLSYLSWMMDTYLEKPNGNISEYFKTRKKKDKVGWDIDHVLPKAKGGSSEFLHGIGNLVLLYPTDNRGLQDKLPVEKKKTYLQHPIYLTKTVSSVDELDDADRKKVQKLLKEAGIVKQDWNISSWNDESIVARSEFYFELLKHDLTSF